MVLEALEVRKVVAKVSLRKSRIVVLAGTSEQNEALGEGNKSGHRNRGFRRRRSKRELLEVGPSKVETKDEAQGDQKVHIS